MGYYDELGRQLGRATGRNNKLQQGLGIALNLGADAQRALLARQAAQQQAQEEEQRLAAEKDRRALEIAQRLSERQQELQFKRQAEAEERNIRRREREEDRRAAREDRRADAREKAQERADQHAKELELKREDAKAKREAALEERKNDPEKAWKAKVAERKAARLAELETRAAAGDEDAKLMLGKMIDDPEADVALEERRNKRELGESDAAYNRSRRDHLIDQANELTQRIEAEGRAATREEAQHLRNLHDQIAAENRAEERESARYGRNRQDTLTDQGTAEQRRIEAERRSAEAEQTRHERDVLEGLAGEDRAEKREEKRYARNRADLQADRDAANTREDRLRTEQRLYEFDKTQYGEAQAALLRAERDKQDREKEERQRGYKKEDREQTILDQIAAEERRHEQELKDKEADRKYQEGRTAEGRTYQEGREDDRRKWEEWQRLQGQERADQKESKKDLKALKDAYEEASSKARKDALDDGDRAVREMPPMATKFPTEDEKLQRRVEEGELRAKTVKARLQLYRGIYKVDQRKKEYEDALKEAGGKPGPGGGGLPGGGVLEGLGGASQDTFRISGELDQRPLMPTRVLEEPEPEAPVRGSLPQIPREVSLLDELVEPGKTTPTLEQFKKWRQQKLGQTTDSYTGINWPAEYQEFLKDPKKYKAEIESARGLNTGRVEPDVLTQFGPALLAAGPAAGRVGAALAETSPAAKLGVGIAGSYTGQEAGGELAESVGVPRIYGQLAGSIPGGMIAGAAVAPGAALGGLAAEDVLSNITGEAASTAAQAVGAGPVGQTVAGIAGGALAPNSVHTSPRNYDQEVFEGVINSLQYKNPSVAYQLYRQLDPNSELGRQAAIEIQSTPEGKAYWDKQQADYAREARNAGIIDPTGTREGDEIQAAYTRLMDEYASQPDSKTRQDIAALTEQITKSRFREMDWMLSSFKDVEDFLKRKDQAPRKYYKTKEPTSPEQERAIEDVWGMMDTLQEQLPDGMTSEALRQAVTARDSTHAEGLRASIPTELQPGFDKIIEELRFLESGGPPTRSEDVLKGLQRAEELDPDERAGLIDEIQGTPVPDEWKDKPKYVPYSSGDQARRAFEDELQQGLTEIRRLRGSDAAIEQYKKLEELINRGANLGYIRDPKWYMKEIQQNLSEQAAPIEHTPPTKPTLYPPTDVEGLRGRNMIRAYLQMGNEPNLNVRDLDLIGAGLRKELDRPESMIPSELRQEAELYLQSIENRADELLRAEETRINELKTQSSEEFIGTPKGEDDVLDSIDKQWEAMARGEGSNRELGPDADVAPPEIDEDGRAPLDSGDAEDASDRAYVKAFGPQNYIHPAEDRPILYDQPQPETILDKLTYLPHKTPLVETGEINPARGYEDVSPRQTPLTKEDLPQGGTILDDLTKEGRKLQPGGAQLNLGVWPSPQMIQQAKGAYQKGKDFISKVFSRQDDSGEERAIRAQLRKQGKILQPDEVFTLGAADISDVSHAAPEVGEIMQPAYAAFRRQVENTFKAVQPAIEKAGVERHSDADAALFHYLDGNVDEDWLRNKFGQAVVDAGHKMRAEYDWLFSLMEAKGLAKRSQYRRDYVTYMRENFASIFGNPDDMAIPRELRIKYLKPRWDAKPPSNPSALDSFSVYATAIHRKIEMDAAFKQAADVIDKYPDTAIGNLQKQYTSYYINRLAGRPNAMSATINSIADAVAERTGWDVGASRLAMLAKSMTSGALIGLNLKSAPKNFFFGMLTAAAGPDFRRALKEYLKEGYRKTTDTLQAELSGGIKHPTRLGKHSIRSWQDVFKLSQWHGVSDKLKDWIYAPQNIGTNITAGIGYYQGRFQGRKDGAAMMLQGQALERFAHREGMRRAKEIQDVGGKMEQSPAFGNPVLDQLMQFMRPAHKQTQHVYAKLIWPALTKGRPAPILKFLGAAGAAALAADQLGLDATGEVFDPLDPRNLYGAKRLVFGEDAPAQQLYKAGVKMPTDVLSGLKNKVTGSGDFSDAFKTGDFTDILELTIPGAVQAKRAVKGATRGREELEKERQGIGFPVREPNVLEKINSMTMNLPSKRDQAISAMRRAKAMPETSHAEEEAKDRALRKAEAELRKFR